MDPTRKEVTEIQNRCTGLPHHVLQGPFTLKVKPSAKPNSIPSTFMAESNSSDLPEEKPQPSEILWIKYEEGTLSQQQQPPSPPKKTVNRKTVMKK